jgi:hypothetical protein
LGYHHAFALPKLLDRIGIGFECIGFRKRSFADRVLFDRLAQSSAGLRVAT